MTNLTPFQTIQANARYRVRNVEQFAGTTAYARPNGDIVTVHDLGLQDGEWSYRATLLRRDGDGDNGMSATFHSKSRPTEQGLKQRAARALAA